MKKSIILILFFFLINNSIFSQIGKWTPLDSFSFPKFDRTLISCVNNLNCSAICNFRNENNKYCASLFFSNIDIPTWHWKMQGIDCERLIYDSINQEYYYYGPPVAYKAELLKNYNLLIISRNNEQKNELFISSGFKDFYRKIIFDSSLINKKGNYLELSISPNKTCYLFFANEWKEYLPTSKRIYISEDYGVSWKEVTFSDKDIKLKSIWPLLTPTDNDLFLLTFYNSEYKNILYHSSDKGHNWEEINYPFDTLANHRLEALYFLNSNIGWVACNLNENNIDKGILYKTTNCGKTWFEQYRFERSGFSKIEFVDENNGFILNNTEGYYSSDGGYSWITIYDYYNEKLNTKPEGLNFYDILDANSFIAYRKYGNGACYLFEINPTKIKEIFKNRNHLFTTYNNINDIINIYFNNKINDIINIKLFNLYGNLLEEKTFSAYLEGATYEIDVSNYSQGIYFISCTVEGVTEVKKICIIR